MNKITFMLLPFFPLLGTILTTSRADADCARPLTYWMEVERNTVFVCPVNYGDRSCPDPGGMLRQNGSTEQAVLLAADCVERETLYYDVNSCYIDECVPPGTYHYGFLVPYTCWPYACGTYYYDDITVSQPMDDCVREQGTTPPQPFDGPVPWSGGDPLICSYQGREPNPELSEETREDGQAQEETRVDRGEESHDDGDGHLLMAEGGACGCCTAGGTAPVVITVNLIALLLGFWLLLVERNR